MFDVLEEKWIPVVDVNSQKYDVSLREAILNAHRIVELAESDSILECALYRFLFAFVSDMMSDQCENDEEIEDVIETLYERGSFDAELLDRYIDQCRADGTSFDLFDEEHPFMQNGQYPFTDNDIVSVAKMTQRGASGTNKLFQCHKTEDEAWITCSEAAKLLLAQSPFNTPGGAGWGSNHFGAYPPLFSYVTGKSLYETIVFNIIVNEGGDRRDNRPYWRMDLTGIEKNTVAPSFSVLAAMQYPWRFTKLIAATDNHVKKMYYVPGFKIDKTRPDILRDPFATYIVSKKGEQFLLCPKDSDLAWKNISGLFEQRSAPVVINRYRSLKEVMGLDNISVIAYVTIVKDVHGTFTGAWKNKVMLPVEVLDSSSYLLDCIGSAVTYAEDKLSALNKAAGNVIGKEDYKRIKPVMESRFYSVCRNIFFNDFLPSLSTTNLTSLDEWRKKVQRLALDLFDRFIVDSINDMEHITRGYYQRRFLFDKKD